MRNIAWMSLAALALALGGCDDGGMDTMDAGDTPGVDGGPSTTDGGGGDEDGGGTPDPDGGGGDLDGGAAPDGGGGPVDAGPGGCAPGTIRIEETACTPAFAACGGSLVGEWCYSDICLTKDELLAPILPSIREFAMDCDAADIEVIASSGTVDGRIEFTAATVTRDVTTSATGTFRIGPDCELSTVCNVTGALLNAALADAMLGTASCVNRADGMDGCDCDVTFTNTAMMTGDAYTIDGGDTIVLTSSGRRFEYCIGTGGDLSFREVGTDAIEPGTQSAAPITP